MNYYIVQSNPESDYQIIKVKRKDEADFLKSYQGRIISKGKTMYEAYRKFKEAKKELYPNPMREKGKKSNGIIMYKGGKDEFGKSAS